MKPNGCHSGKRPDENTRLIVQDGYFDPPANREGPFTRVPKYREIKFVMSSPCVAGPDMSDKRCGAFPDLGLEVCPHLGRAEV